MFGNKHILYYTCCFCPRPDSSFSLSHFLGEPSSIYDKTNPDWAPNQNLGYDFRGVLAFIHSQHLSANSELILEGEVTY